MKHTIALGAAALLALAACAPQTPRISYDDPTALHSEPPKPVSIVQVPELLPLPGQLKRLPRGARSASVPEPRDPARRVQLAMPPPASNRPAPATSMRSKSIPTAMERCTSSTSLRCTSPISRSSPARN